MLRRNRMAQTFTISVIVVLAVAFLVYGSRTCTWSSTKKFHEILDYRTVSNGRTIIYSFSPTTQFTLLYKRPGVIGRMTLDLPITDPSLMSPKHKMNLSTFLLNAHIVNSPDQTSVAFVTKTLSKRSESVQTVWVLSRRYPRIGPIFRVTGSAEKIDAIFWTRNLGIVVQMGANLVQISSGGKPHTICTLPAHEYVLAIFNSKTIIMYSVSDDGSVGGKVLYDIHTGRTVNLGNFIMGNPQTSGKIPIACPMDQSDQVYSIDFLSASGMIQHICNVGTIDNSAPELSPDEQKMAISLQPNSGPPTLNIIDIRSRKSMPIRDYRGALVHGRNPRWSDSHSLLFVAPDRGNSFFQYGQAGLPNESEALYEFDMVAKRTTRLWPS